MIIKQKNIWDREYRNNFNMWNLENKNLPLILKGKKVLEIGVGNGKTLKAIMNQKPRLIYTLDISIEAIKRCRTIFERRINFLNMDVKEMKFDSETFDIVICNYVLNNMLFSDRKKSISEIKRVLKPGGNLLFEDFSVGDFRQDNHIKKIEKNTQIKNNGLIYHFFDKAEIVEMFKEFSELKIRKKIFNPIKKDKSLKRIIFNCNVVK